MKKTKNGSYKVSRFEVFINVKFWRWGSYHIGETTVLRLGPMRIFVFER